MTTLLSYPAELDQRGLSQLRRRAAVVLRVYLAPDRKNPHTLAWAEAVRRELWGAVCEGAISPQEYQRGLAKMANSEPTAADWWVEGGPN